MSDPITPEISNRICKHMNEDHGDAIVLYAKFFGKVEQAQKAQMESIDPQGMNLSVICADQTMPIRIEFDHTLEHSEDAHQTLIEMVKQARIVNS